MAKLLAGAATDAGPAREQNEDAVRLAEPGSPSVARHGFLAAVADGMGGHQHGEVASRLAVDALFASFYGDGADGAGGAADLGAGERLRRGFRLANERIAAQAREMAVGDGQAGQPGRSMGATMVAAAIVGDQLTVANVGDSRAYLLRAEGATQITQDHSLVAEQVKAGVMTPEEARESNHRNIVTRALGHRQKLDVDLFEIVLLPDDRVILCTDGVHGYVEPEELVEFGLQGNPGDVSRTFIELAMERGSTDNVTMAVVAYEPALVAPDGAREPVAAGGTSSAVRLLLVLLIVAAIIAGIIFLVLSGTFR